MVETSAGRLGAVVASLKPDDAKRLGVEPFSGVIVRSVESDGPAERSGLGEDDVITTFSAKPVTDPDKLGYLIAEAPPGALVDLEVRRSGSPLKVQVELGRETRTLHSRVVKRKLPVLDDSSHSGLQVVELDEEAAALALGAPSAGRAILVTRVLPGGPAFFADLRVRDRLTHAAGLELATLDDFGRTVASAEPGTKVPVAVARDGRTLLTSLRVEENARSTTGFDFLGLVKYRSEPCCAHFSLLWGLLFHGDTCYQVRKSPPQNDRERHWGAVIDLVSGKRERHHKEIRFLWLFPISVKSED
jgi:serine protease Do